MSRSPLIVVGAALLGLALPAAAQATTWTVNPTATTPCGGANTTCAKIADAAANANANDTIQILPGRYQESIRFTQPGLQIVGGTIAPGIPAVFVDGTLTFVSTVGPATALERVVVYANDGASPAIDVQNDGGLSVRDSVLGSLYGPAVNFSGSQSNAIIRTAVFAGGQAANAVQFYSAGNSPNAKALAIESSILSGAGGGAGLYVEAQANALASEAGDVTITGRHVTIAGSQNGIVLDNSAANGSFGLPPLLAPNPAGNILSNFFDSIVLGVNIARTNPGVPLLAAENTAELRFARTDTQTPAELLFLNPAGRNFRLLPNAPVIDKGQLFGAESGTDIDGDPRLVGAATDLGADEYINKPPTADIRITSGEARQARDVTFDASRSNDPGDVITAYRWDFGDGQTAVTAVPTVSHKYAGQGPVTASVVAVDATGLASAPATVALVVLDGVGPKITVATPAKNSTFRRTTRSTKTVTRKGKKVKVRTTKKNRLRFTGAASDAAGVKSVLLALQQVSRVGVKSGTSQKCRWVDPKRRKVVVRRCLNPVLITAKLGANGAWSYSMPTSMKLSPGSYRLFTFGFDNNGGFGNDGGDIAVSFKVR